MNKALLRQRAMNILWPAFLMAGVLEMLVFAVIDPQDLRWFGGEALGWSAQAIYTVSFGMFWAVISTAGALTVLLAMPEDEVNAARRNAPHWPR